MEKLEKIVDEFVFYRCILKGLSYTDMYSLVDIYNELVLNGHPEFIQFSVKKVLDDCGIMTAPKGIGWIAYPITLH